jgi:CRP/FNR family cyclic AMP-dependent transcriptional regulator
MKSLISLENRLTFLLTTPMFEHLELEEIREIIHIVETRKYDAGDIIFREGEPGDAWYALYRGEVDVVKESDSGQQSIRTLEPPSCFGEIAILDGLPRSATVRATKETLVMRIPQEKFKELMDEEHLVACKLIKHMALVLVSELRSNTEMLSELLKTNSIESVHEGISSIVGESAVRD